MSRYVQVGLAAADHAEIQAALNELGIVCEIAPRGLPLSLRESVECQGDPVALRCAAGTLGTVADFGFASTEGGLALVCSELDRALLNRVLVPPLLTALTIARAQTSGHTVDVVVERAGARRIVLKSPTGG